MFSQTRERVLRSIVSTILDLNLSSEEILSISREFESGRLGKDVGRALEFIVKISGQTRIDQKAIEPNSDFSSFYKRIQNKKVQKSAVFYTITKIDPEIANSISESSTMREIMKLFFERASADKWNKFWSIIDGYEGKDSYLKGIMKKR